jgi:hypothetical protein
MKFAPHSGVFIEERPAPKTRKPITYAETVQPTQLSSVPASDASISEPALPAKRARLPTTRDPSEERPEDQDDTSTLSSNDAETQDPDKKTPHSEPLPMKGTEIAWTVNDDDGRLQVNLPHQERSEFLAPDQRQPTTQNPVSSIPPLMDSPPPGSPGTAPGSQETYKIPKKAPQPPSDSPSVAPPGPSISILFKDLSPTLQQELRVEAAKDMRASGKSDKKILKSYKREREYQSNGPSRSKVRVRLRERQRQEGRDERDARFDDYP